MRSPARRPSPPLQAPEKTYKATVNRKFMVDLDANGHYGDPKDGCMSDETEITIQGVQGDFCTPKCSLFKACPTDVPAGVTVAPQCALQDSSTGDKYCALICSPTLPILDQKAADAQCGDNASCKSVQLGVGVCTYDD